MTVQQALNSQAPSLGAIQRVKGKDFTEGLIMGWLVYLNDILDLNKKMSDDQIEMCAIEINNEFYGLKMSDLTLLFKRIISGHYGEFYEALSITKVLTFFRSYFEERLDTAESESSREHGNFTSNDTFNYSKNLRRIFENGAKKSK